MRQSDKKEVKAIYNELSALQARLEQLCEDHLEWMDERDDETDGRFSNSATGERADDEQYRFDDWKDSIESMCNEIEEMLNL